jgi:hypothetical protein
VPISKNGGKARENAGDRSATSLIEGISGGTAFKSIDERSPLHLELPHAIPERFRNNGLKTGR